MRNAPWIRLLLVAVLVALNAAFLATQADPKLPPWGQCYGGGGVCTCGMSVTRSECHSGADCLRMYGQACQWNP